jgi:protein disulfide-isomerase A1
MICFKYIIKFFLLSLLVNITFQDVSSPDVVELTDSTLKNFLNQNENVLLEFYTEGCPHCEEFAPVYNDIAKHIKSNGLNVQVAKIDGNKFEELTNEYGVQGFPTVYFINTNKNITSEYSGERTVEAVSRYLENKLNRKVLGINDSSHLTQLQNEKKVFIVFCGTNDTYPEAFSQFDLVLAQHDDLEFYFSNNADVLNTLGCNSQSKGDLVIVKNFDEGNLKYEYDGNVNATHFQEWISVYTTPVLLELNDQNIQMSMHNHIPSIFFITNNATDNKNLNDLIYRKASQHRVIFH